MLPTRDRPAELRRALSAARAQRDVALEVVVVDDGSVPPVAVEDEGVRLIRVEPSRGVAHARNCGIAAAQGEWIALLDDDDVWAPDRLSRMLALGRATAADAVVSRAIAIDGQGRATAVNPLPDPRRLARDLRSQNVVGGPSCVVVARAALERTGGFDESFDVLADWELWLRLAGAGTFAVCPEVLTGYVVHPGSMHVTKTDAAVREFERLRARYGVARTADDEGLHDEQFTRWAADVHRRAGRRRAAARLYLKNWRRHGKTADLARGLLTPLGERLLRKANPRPAPAPPEPPGWLALYLGPGGLRALQ